MAKENTFPALPPDFDTGRFVFGKVQPMVCGLFPTKELMILIDMVGEESLPLPVLGQGFFEKLQQTL